MTHQANTGHVVAKRICPRRHGSGAVCARVVIVVQILGCASARNIFGIDAVIQNERPGLLQARHGFADEQLGVLCVVVARLAVCDKASLRLIRVKVVVWQRSVKIRRQDDDVCCA